MRKDCKHFSRIGEVCWACDYKDEQENRTDTITALESKFALAIEALENTKKQLEIIYSHPEFRALSASYKIVNDALAKIKSHGRGSE